MPQILNSGIRKMTEKLSFNEAKKLVNKVEDWNYRYDIDNRMGIYKGSINGLEIGVNEFESEYEDKAHPYGYSIFISFNGNSLGLFGSSDKPSHRKNTYRKDIMKIYNSLGEKIEQRLASEGLKRARELV